MLPQLAACAGMESGNTMGSDGESLWMEVCFPHETQQTKGRLVYDENLTKLK